MEKERDTFRVGVNVFVIRKGKLLLGNRKDDWPGGGGWGIPGGHLEKGERMQDAVARELEEETGLSARKFIFCALVNDVRQGGDNQIHYIHVGFVVDGFENQEPQLCEPDRCYEWRWFDLNNLPTDIFIGHRKLMEAFKKQQPFIE